MKCHYINVRAVGRVLIPGCMAVAVSNDIERCTCCDILTERTLRSNANNDVVKRLKQEISELRQENEMLRKGYIKIT